MRLDQFDLNLLILLHTLLEEQSVSRTATRLNLTQPAISNALAKLRLHFNDPLLERFGPHLRPTPLALQLRAQITPTLVQIRALVGVRGGFDPLTTSAKLVVGCSDWFASTHLVRLLRRLPAIAPRIQIDHQRISPSVTTAMQEGKVDLLVLRAERLLSDQPSSPLATDAVYVIGCADQAPFKTTGARLRDLITLPQVMAVTQEGTPLMPQLHGALAREHIVTTTGSASLLPLMVMQSSYIAFVPQSSADYYRSFLAIRAAPVRDVAPTVMHMQWHRSRDLDPVLGWLREQIMSVQNEVSKVEQESSFFEKKEDSS